MKYYLSGAISSQPYYKSYFEYYENCLKRMGITDIFNPTSVEWPEDKEWKTCMRYDIKILMDCDYLVLLPNQWKSKGARIEKKLAKQLGIRVIKINDLIRELFLEEQEQAKKLFIKEVK